jgi:hypothetical protein
METAGSQDFKSSSTRARRWYEAAFVSEWFLSHSIFTADSQDIIISDIPGRFDWLLKHSNAEIRAIRIDTVSRLAKDSLSPIFLA